MPAGRSRSLGTESTGLNQQFMVFTGVVVSGSFSPTDHAFTVMDSLHVEGRMESRGAQSPGAVAARRGLALLLAAVAAPAARAGAIWVTDGTGSCNAFSVYGDLASSFIAPSGCPMSIQAVRGIP